MFLKKITNLFVSIILTTLIFILGSNIWIVYTSKSSIYDLSNVPFNEVALVLGTSKLTSSGNENRFFKERMYAVAALHRQGSIRHILLSGDNSSKYYNEPIDMLNALSELDISDTVVSLDYAGFRTLDSIVRSKQVFGQGSITIVTQEFHCYRSLFIAKYFGINAVAVSADDGGSVGNLLAMREILARTMSVLDLYVFRRKPRYLGERIELKIN